MSRSLTAVVLAILLAGCGGGKDAGAGRTQFIAASARACSLLPEPLNRIPIEGGGDTLAADINAFADRVDQFVASVRRLAPPHRPALGPAEALVASIDRLAPAIRGVRLASDRLAATPPTGTTAVGPAMAQLGVSLRQFQRLVAAAGQVATANGFKQCGQSLRVPPIPNESAACHRIGGSGNAGPGPDLTAIGTRLPSSAIARELRDPVAPMPSYRALPTGKFEELVAFLAGLRGQAPGGVPSTSTSARPSSPP